MALLEPAAPAPIPDHTLIVALEFDLLGPKAWDQGKGEPDCLSCSSCFCLLCISRERQGENKVVYHERGVLIDEPGHDTCPSTRLHGLGSLTAAIELHDQERLGRGNLNGGLAPCDPLGAGRRSGKGRRRGPHRRDNRSKSEYFMLSKKVVGGEHPTFDAALA